MGTAINAVTAAIALGALVVAILAYRRSGVDAKLARELTAREAARDRMLAGPVPDVSLVVQPYHPEGHILRVVVTNRGRTAITMVGGGLAFDLPDGGLRHITIGLNEEVRVDSAGAPRSYIVTAPVLRNVLDSAAPDAEILPFVSFGTGNLYGEPPIQRALVAQFVEKAAAAPDQTFAVWDAHETFIIERELRSGPDGRAYTLSDPIYHAFLEVQDPTPSRRVRDRRSPSSGSSV